MSASALRATGDFAFITKTAWIFCAASAQNLCRSARFLMNGCRIGKNCIIGAGAIITGGKEIPDNSLVVGNPGKILRQVTEAEVEENLKNARLYVEEAAAQTTC